MPAASNAPRIEVRSRADLRDWLSRWHANAPSHWLVTFKKSSPHHLPYPQIVEELLCWGWVDGLPRALDGERTMLLISQRKETSAWSAVNKAHVARAQASGAMTPAGEAKISAAKANGMWHFLDDVEALIVPNDLAAAFAAHPPARTHWDAFPKSVRRGILEWIKTAKRAETREKRILDTALKAREDRRANQFR